MSVHTINAGQVKPRLGNGTLATSSGDGQSYLIANGERQLVTNVSALFAAGIDPVTAPRVELPDDVLKQFPLVSRMAGLVGTRGVDTGDQFLGAGHYMRTWGSVDAASGAIAMQTRIRTITMFGGYHGSVHIIFGDSGGNPVYQTQDHRYGVDGTWVGQSDRTQAWWESMGAVAAARTAQVAVFQSWAPDSFQTILNNWTAAGKSIVDLVTAAGSVAKVFTAVF
jgi:hypothetical protein